MITNYARHALKSESIDMPDRVPEAVHGQRSEQPELRIDNSAHPPENEGLSPTGLIAAEIQKQKVSFVHILGVLLNPQEVRHINKIYRRIGQPRNVKVGFSLMVPSHPFVGIRFSMFWISAVRLACQYPGRTRFIVK